MSKKSIICFKDISLNVPVTLTAAITSNATQKVSLTTKNIEAFSIDKSSMEFSKNNSSDSFSIIGRVPGNYSLHYEVGGDYTNEQLSNGLSITVIDPTTLTNGFVNIDPGCPAVISIDTSGSISDGNTVGFATLDAGSHSVVIGCDSGESYTLYAVDPDGAVQAHAAGASVTININNKAGVWQFIPAKEFLLTTDGSNLLVPSGTFTMSVDGITGTSLYASYQGIAYFRVNQCPTIEYDNNTPSGSSSSSSSSGIMT
jgi:hypothetical protein